MLQLCSALRRKNANNEHGSAIALELYRQGKISLRVMGELAGVGSDYWAAENFRVQHKAPLNYSAEDLEADRETAERLLKR
jgi:predicted HTH domain antitoxin